MKEKNTVMMMIEVPIGLAEDLKKIPGSYWDSFVERAFTDALKKYTNLKKAPRTLEEAKEEIKRRLEPKLRDLIKDTVTEVMGEPGDILGEKNVMRKIDPDKIKEVPDDLSEEDLYCSKCEHLRSCQEIDDSDEGIIVLTNTPEGTPMPDIVKDIIRYLQGK